MTSPTAIDWSRYMALFGQIKTRQRPLDPTKQRELEVVLADLLELDPNSETPWGVADGVGNSTEVVVRLHGSPERADLKELAQELGRPVAVRLMRPGKGAKDVAFQQSRITAQGPLNGPDSPQVQRALAAGDHQGWGYVLQEWIEGVTLEWMHRNHWPSPPLSGSNLTRLWTDLVEGVIIPAWSLATPTSGVLWDIRDANFVVDGSGAEPRLYLVDTGNLRHLLKDVDNRAGQIGQGLKRLHATAERLLKSQGKWAKCPRNWRLRFEDAWTRSGLETSLRDLADGGPDTATAACNALLDDMERQDLLRG